MLLGDRTMSIIVIGTGMLLAGADVLPGEDLPTIELPGSNDGVPTDEDGDYSSRYGHSATFTTGCHDAEPEPSGHTAGTVSNLRRTVALAQ
jgi:hypothetical protein